MSEMFNSETLIIAIIVINLMLLILYILNNIKLSKLRKNYSSFMSKLGNGNNIYEMLEKYVSQVDKIDSENKEIKDYCAKLDNKVKNDIHKIGIVRYNAYKDTGSNLSFALCMLNEFNNGVVFNGIYSRDTSNIYCKTITNGKSEYALSKEEEEAIKEAINQKYMIMEDKKDENM